VGAGDIGDRQGAGVRTWVMAQKSKKLEKFQKLQILDFIGQGDMVNAL
jgi:hypothetical protein